MYQCLNKLSLTNLESVIIHLTLREMLVYYLENVSASFHIALRVHRQRHKEERGYAGTSRTTYLLEERYYQQRETFQVVFTRLLLK